MANEVPVVQPRHGVFPEMIEKTGGGILVDPDSVDSLAEGIFSLWRDQEHADELGRRGAEGVRAHYSAALMAQRAVEVYGRVGQAFLSVHGSATAETDPIPMLDLTR